MGHDGDNLLRFKDTMKVRITTVILKFYTRLENGRHFFENIITSGREFFKCVLRDVEVCSTIFFLVMIK